MKKFIFSLFALVGMAGTVSAQSVKVADVYAQPGETVVASLNFECPADIYTGMQVALQFSADFSCTVAKEEAISGWAGLIPYEYEDGVLKYSAAGTSKFSSATINLEFTIGEVENGEYPVKVTGQMEGPGEDGSIVTAFPDVTFNVIVNDEYITLSEESQVAPKATSANEKVKVIRTINANEWSTICLPFAMNATDVANAFDGAEIAELGGYEVEKDDKDKVTGLKVTFNKSTVIRANQPYIIKVNSAVKDFIVTKKISSGPIPKEIENDETLEIYASMIGTHVAQTVVPAQSLFLSEGKFWYSVGKTKMKAFRAYFTFTDVLSSVADAPSSVRFFVTDGDTQTEIQIPELMPNDGQYYDLKGQRVETPSKGIYIKDGKKVVVK